MDIKQMTHTVEQATDRKAAVIEMGTALLAELAPAFTFDTEATVRRAGVCKYRLDGGGTVALSVHYIKHATAADVVDTLLHEVAHAIAGHAAGHGPEWKRVARLLGCSANRCADLPAAMRGGRYEARCSAECCDHALGYRQRLSDSMRHRAMCQHCKAAVEWIDHGSAWMDSL